MFQFSTVIKTHSTSWFSPVMGIIFFGSNVNNSFEGLSLRRLSIASVVAHSIGRPECKAYLVLGQPYGNSVNDFFINKVKGAKSP